VWGVRVPSCTGERPAPWPRLGEPVRPALALHKAALPPSSAPLASRPAPAPTRRCMARVLSRARASALPRTRAGQVRAKELGQMALAVGKLSGEDWEYTGRPAAGDPPEDAGPEQRGLVRAVSGFLCFRAETRLKAAGDGLAPRGSSGMPPPAATRRACGWPGPSSAAGFSRGWGVEGSPTPRPTSPRVLQRGRAQRPWVHARAVHESG
jgi:hypothetical protein